MDTWFIATIITKYLIYINTFILIGGIFYLHLFSPSQSPKWHFGKKPILVAALMLLILVLVSYAVNAASLTGEISGMMDIAMLKLLWDSPVGSVLAWQIAGIIICIVGLYSRSLWLQVAGSMVFLFSFTLVGHTTDLAMQITPFLLFSHLVLVALWLGAFYPLYKLTKSKDKSQNLYAIFSKFGKAGSYFVPILLLTGGILTWFLLGEVSRLYTTTYGNILAVKIILVSGLLLIAATNKFYLVPLIKKNKANSVLLLRRSILLEMVLAALVLLITATLTNTSITNM